MKICRLPLMITVLGLGMGGALGANSSPEDSQLMRFRRVCVVAMDDMMDAMAKPTTGDVDKDFVQMMKPHHQAAIDMAQAELSHGSNEKLRRIAQEIIVDQQQEMLAMDMAIAQSSTTNTTAPDASENRAINGESK